MILDSFLIKLAVFLLMSYIFILCINNIKLFILIYIALRSFFAVFYDVNLIGGLNILEFLGFFFPIVLILYWAKNEKFRVILLGYANIYSLILLWILFSNLASIVNHGFQGIESLSSFFRILNGYSAFMIFPLIFREIKDVDSLINAFFISTIFPLLQGFSQIFVGGNILGMGTSISRGGQTDFVMYYGLYYKYDGYAWAALLGGLVLIYKTAKINSSRRASNRQGIFYVILLVFFIVLASVTLSRLLFVSLFFIAILIFFNLKKHLKIAFLVLILFFVTGSFFQERYRQLILRSESEIKAVKGELPVDYAFHGRMSLWQRKLSDFNSRSFLQRLIGTPIGVGPHSDYFQWLFSHGYIGLFLYLFLLIKLFNGCLGKMRRTKNINMRTDYVAYGQMVIAGLIIWILEAFIHNPSYYLDYSYMIIGNAAIFLNLRASGSHNR